MLRFRDTFRLVIGPDPAFSNRRLAIWKKNGLSPEGQAGFFHSRCMRASIGSGAAGESNGNGDGWMFNDY